MNTVDTYLFLGGFFTAVLCGGVLLVIITKEILDHRPPLNITVYTHRGRLLPDQTLEPEEFEEAKQLYEQRFNIPVEWPVPKRNGDHHENAT